MRRSLAAGAALLAAVGEGAAVGVSPSGADRWNEAAVGAVVVAYAGVGLLVLWHRPHHPVGRIALLAAMVWGPGQLLVDLGARLLRQDPDDRTGALASVLGSSLGGLAWLVLVLWLPLVFPDSTVAGTRLRRTARRVVTATIGCFVVVNLLSPNLTRLEFDHIDSPVGLPHRFTDVLGGLAGLSLLLGLVGLGLVVACLVQQYRHGGPLTRQQTLVFALAFLPPVAAFAASATDAADPWLFGVCTLPLPIAIGVAVLQRRLYDLPLVVNRSLTYAGLWVVIAALYAVVVGGVGAMLRQQGASWLPWLAAGIVAVSFAPLRDALQHAANRLTFGQWARPGEVLTRTARRLADVGDVEKLLGSLATDLSEDMGLGRVVITGLDGRVLAAAGPAGTDLDELTLTAYGAPVGALRWTRRPLRDVDRNLLADVALQLGSVVHAHDLLATVRAAQERLVLAHEEERRRLRRDLHDGLGPALAALTMQVDTLRNTTDDELTRAGLLTLRGHIQDAVVDVRSVVEGLQPAALADLGLEESLRQLSARFSQHDSLDVAVETDVPAGLPAAVEVGAYRIVQESLSNAARHSGAHHVRVGVRLRENCLEVSVSDDGSGELRPRRDGVGLGSMRGRAEEIGGRFELVAEAGRGTTVIARLPVDGRSRP